MWFPFPPVKNPMTKIGIVSKLDHCKAHKAALENLGFEVVLLGSNPTSFPDSLRVVVVRILSISHGGDKCARVWGKEPGRTLIYENGLTGILRRLQELGILKGDSHMAELSCVPNPSPFSESGVEVSHPKHLSLQKVSSCYLGVLKQFRKVPEKVVSEANSLTNVKDSSDFTPSVKQFCELIRPYFKYSGDPTSAFIFFYLLSNPGFTPYVRDILKCYTVLCGKEAGYGWPKIVAWHMGFPIPTSVKSQTRDLNVQDSPEPVLEVPGENQSQHLRDPIGCPEECFSGTPQGVVTVPFAPQNEVKVPVAPPSPAIEGILSSNTDSILGLMIEVENLRRTVDNLSAMMNRLLEIQVAKSEPDLRTSQYQIPDVSELKLRLAESGFRGKLSIDIE